MNTRQADRPHTDHPRHQTIFDVVFSARYAWFERMADDYLLAEPTEDGRQRVRDIGPDTLSLFAPNVTAVTIENIR